MKNTKKFAAFVASILAVACMAAPMATSFSADAYTITVSNGIADSEYAAYQIFTGSLQGTGSEAVLGNITWGTNVDDTALVTKLKAADADTNSKLKGVFGFTNDADWTASNIAAKLKDVQSKSDAAKELAQIIGLCLKGNPTKGTTSITIDAAGYYLIKDNAAITGDNASTSYILQVVDDVTVSPKSAKPTVDKQIWDEEADAESGHTAGWGESADHAINEIFQFKLIATIPNDNNLDDYTEYKLVFHDTYSVGVTYDANVKVMVGDTELKATDYNIISNTTDRTLDIEIPDLIASLGAENGSAIKGQTVTVTYDAHLNENADIVEATIGTHETTNENDVYLEYSNNPNWKADGSGQSDDTGETEKDYVWAFTYTVDNLKVDGAAEVENTPMAGAGFKLYDSTGTTEIKLAYNDTLGAYVPTTGDGVEMITKADGLFNIKGLDAGTYVLKETTTPAGYNTAADITVIIKAEHAEKASADGATVNLTGSSNIDNKVVNEKGSSLPSTGGIGTTIFYVAGGALVVGAGVLLVSKKRMSNK